MSGRHHALSFLLALGASAAAAPSQIFLVDAGDPAADFQSLETALSSVPSGATLWILSDIQENGGDSVYHVVQDELTIIGDRTTRPTVHGELWTGFSGGGLRVTCSSVDWDSSGLNAHIGTIVQWMPGSFLHMDHASVRTAPGLSSLSRGAPLNGVQLLSNCDLLGDEQFFATVEQTSDGTLVLQDCLVSHGLGAPEDALWVEHGKCYASNTVFAGDVFVGPNGQFTVLPNALQLDPAALVPGGTLSLSANGTPNGPCVLLVTVAAATTGLDLPQGALLIGAPFSIIQLPYDATGSWAFAVPIPNSPLVTGLPLYFQAYDAFAGILSEIEGGVVRG